MAMIWDVIKFPYRFSLCGAWLVGIGAHGIIALNKVGDPLAPAIVGMLLGGFSAFTCRELVIRRMAQFNMSRNQEFLSSSATLIRTIDRGLTLLAIATFTAYYASFYGFMFVAETGVIHSRDLTISSFIVPSLVTLSLFVLSALLDRNVRRQADGFALQ